jgi:hypothetical protein
MIQLILYNLLFVDKTFFLSQVVPKNRYNFLSNNDNVYKKNVNNNFETLKLLSQDNNIIKNKLLNEAKFLLNRRTKVYIHLEQLITHTNIYHIGISFKTIFRTIRYDIRPDNFVSLENLPYNTHTKYKTLFWDYSIKTINEIEEYEKNMDFKYFLGVNDCRHYVNNLTLWSSNNPTPIWRLYMYFDDL